MSKEDFWLDISGDHSSVSVNGMVDVGGLHAAVFTLYGGSIYGTIDNRFFRIVEPEVGEYHTEENYLAGFRTPLPKTDLHARIIDRVVEFENMVPEPLNDIETIAQGIDDHDQMVPSGDQQRHIVNGRIVKVYNASGEHYGPDV